MVRHALASEDKAARRAQILAAAAALFRRDGGQLPPVARIAEAAGLAKGTVYLYFRTKEEIFMALLAEDLAGLLAVATECFAQDRWREFGLDGFIARYVAFIDSHPDLLRLDAMAYGVIEPNLDRDILRAFKLRLTSALVETGALLDGTLGLAAGRGTSLLMRCYALTRGLWQSLDMPPFLREILADAVFAPIRPEFRAELVDMLGEYWRGAFADRRP